MLTAVIIKVVAMAKRKVIISSPGRRMGWRVGLNYLRTFIREIAVHVLCETNAHQNLRQLGCFTYVT